MGEIGVITEQGDLGLGYEEISEKDKAIIENKETNNTTPDKTNK